MDDLSLLYETLTHTPLLVVSASLQGPVGLLRESAALYRSLGQMLEQGAGYPLIERLRLALKTPPQPPESARVPEGAGNTPPAPPAEKSLDDLRRETLDRCRRAAAVLNRLAGPDEAAYFKRGLLWVCLQIAQAASEGGGWFGVGAVQVTDEEKEALRQIAFALGLPASETQVERLPEAPPRSAPAGLSETLSPEEWQLVCQAPLWAGLAITVAQPSGPLGLAQEMEALPRALSAASLRYPDNRLVAAVVENLAGQYQAILNALTADLPPGAVDPVQGGRSQAQAALLDHALQRLIQAAQALDARLEREEAGEFKSLVLDLARQVAEAAREGGVLGLGGRLVSGREQETLRRIAENLGITDGS